MVILLLPRPSIKKQTRHRFLYQRNRLVIRKTKYISYNQQRTQKNKKPSFSTWEVKSLTSSLFAKSQQKSSWTNPYFLYWQKIKLNPVNGDCWNCLAHVLYKKRDFEGSQKAVEMALDNVLLINNQERQKQGQSTLSIDSLEKPRKQPYRTYQLTLSKRAKTSNSL